MKTYSFLANEAKEFATHYFYDACDLIVGKKAPIYVPRYLVYPTYFSWLIGKTNERSQGKDIMYATHIGAFDDWREGSVMWGFLIEQTRVVRAKKLEISRLIVLQKDDIRLGKDYISRVLSKMTVAGMYVYLSSTVLLPEWQGQDKRVDHFNWAMYNRDGKFLLLQYDLLTTAEPHKEAVTMLTFAENEVNQKKQVFEKIITNQQKRVVVQENKESNAVERVCYLSNWEPPG